MVKSIIDKHIIEYERYYKSICYSYYNGRYLWEDLFQELYLGFVDCKPDTVLQFNSTGRLNYLGALIIRNIFSKRGYHKKHEDGRTSPLFEVSNISELVDKRMIDDRDDFAEFINKIPDDKLNEIMNDLYKKDWFSHDVFKRVALNENIHQLSKKTTINRKYLTDTYNQTKEYLQKQFEQF